MTFELLLLASALLTIATWVALARYVLQIQAQRAAARSVLAGTVATLARAEVRQLPLAERINAMKPVLDGASRELIMRAAANRGAPDDAFAAVAGFLTDRWGVDALLSDAASHRSARDKWRRTIALGILARLKHPQHVDLLAKAIAEPDQEVGAVALALLGACDDPRAPDLLFGALRSQVQQASRVAMYLDRSAQPLGDRLRALVTDPEPVMRLWSATLLARYPGADTETLLATLTGDSDGRVRKAAIQTLGAIGEIAADCARRLLKDQVTYVRAHAARALGELGRSDLAEEVAPLLGDANWWVRLAAKESLTSMGSEVWPVLMRSLGHSDQFVRNGAAEVFQNLGVLDSLIVMEAASDNPSPIKIDMLHRIAAAGGVRFTDSLIERAGTHVGPRIRQLLATIGLERVEAH